MSAKILVVDDVAMNVKLLADLLAVSASVMPDEQQKIVASGFDAFITKPINLKAFQETVQRFLEKGRSPA